MAWQRDANSVIGSDSDRSSAQASLPAGALFHCTDTKKLWLWDGSTWTDTTGGGGGAPTDAKYVVTELHASLSAEKVHPNSGAPNFDVKHDIADVTSLQSTLDGKAASAHTHTPADVTGTAVITSDARLSDQRVPTDLSVTDGKVAAANKDGVAATPSMRTLGTGAQQAAAGNDSRLSDARTPTAHVLDSATHTISGKTAGQALRATSAAAFAFEAVEFSRGGVIYNPDGVVAVNAIVWRAPFACTVTAVKGYRVGGTGVSINARKNGTLNHLVSDLSLTSADTWTDGGAVSNAAYAAGDKLEIMVVSPAGNPTQVAVQVDFTRP